MGAILFRRYRLGRQGRVGGGGQLSADSRPSRPLLVHLLQVVGLWREDGREGVGRRGRLLGLRQPPLTGAAGQRRPGRSVHDIGDAIGRDGAVRLANIGFFFNLGEELTITNQVF